MQSFLEISVGARGSPLSKIQVEEVYAEIKALHPHIIFRPIYVETTGDIDKLSSLRTRENSDFFTKQIDDMLLENRCRIAIHSAKDLPQPLKEGLIIAALTQGLDASDVLVLKEGRSFPTNGIVATSSLRREECVRMLFPNARFVDIRGNIQERLSKLYQEEVDGVVIAEAALIRLRLTHLNRLKLPGESAPLQGKLAVVCRQNDDEMRTIFGSICSKKSFT